MLSGICLAGKPYIHNAIINKATVIKTSQKKTGGPGVDTFWEEDELIIFLESSLWLIFGELQEEKSSSLREVVLTVIILDFSVIRSFLGSFKGAAGFSVL